VPFDKLETRCHGRQGAEFPEQGRGQHIKGRLDSVAPRMYHCVHWCGSDPRAMTPPQNYSPGLQPQFPLPRGFPYSAAVRVERDITCQQFSKFWILGTLA
jgi:hypothetical protein